MKLYRYQYQMARKFMQKSLGSAPLTPEPSSPTQPPASRPERPSPTYTWLARAMGIGLLVGMVGLWVYSLLQRFGG